MLKEILNESEREFDEKFTHENWAGEKVMDMFCTTTKTKEDPIFGVEDPLISKHKAFLRTHTIKVVEGMIKKVEKMEQITWRDYRDRFGRNDAPIGEVSGYEQCCSDLLSHLNNELQAIKEDK